MSEPLFEMEEFTETVKPGGAVPPQEGDVCAACKTAVKEQWSGISCDCGALWFCY